jgi:hypothetical protein
MKNGGFEHPYPWAEHTEALRTNDPAALLREADGAIRDNDQGRACAAVQRYGELGCEPKPVIDLLLRYATSEEGHDHAEKYYRTASQEFATTRAALRWRHLVALARVTASEYGWVGNKRGQDPGFEEACRLLGVWRRPFRMGVEPPNNPVFRSRATAIRRRTAVGQAGEGWVA